MPRGSCCGTLSPRAVLGESGEMPEVLCALFCSHTELHLSPRLATYQQKSIPAWLLISKSPNYFEPQFPNLLRGGGREQRSVPTCIPSRRSLLQTLQQNFLMLQECGSALVRPVHWGVDPWGRALHPRECGCVNPYLRSEPWIGQLQRLPETPWGWNARAQSLLALHRQELSSFLPCHASLAFWCFPDHLQGQPLTIRICC